MSPLSTDGENRTGKEIIIEWETIDGRENLRRFGKP